MKRKLPFLLYALVSHSVVGQDSDFDVVVTSADAAVMYDVQGSEDLVTWENVLVDNTAGVTVKSVRTNHSDYRFFRARVAELLDGQSLPVLEVVATDTSVVVIPPDPEPGGGGEPVKLLEDFVTVLEPWLRPFTHWKFTEEEREIARTKSGRELIVDELTESEVMELRFEEGMPVFGPGIAEVAPLGDYIPPEADTVRIKVRMMGGQIILGFGAITVALGNASAFTDFKSLSGEDEEWRVIDFSLYDDVSRSNFRSGLLSGDAPMIYLPRYIQEQLILYIGTKSRGTVRIDDIEFVNKGRGGSYPDFDNDDVTITQTISDFETWNPDEVFTASMWSIDLTGPEPTNYRRTHAFSTPNVDFGDVVSPWWPRTEVAQIDATDAEGNPTGTKALAVDQQGLETVIWAGLKTDAPPEGTNGVEFMIKADHELQGGTSPLVVDFSLIAAPPTHQPFPWEESHYPETWTDIGTYFDYYLTSADEAAFPFAMYHARRLLVNHEWARVRIPFADFTCGYSQGTEPDDWRQQRQLVDPQNIVGVVFQSGWQQLRATTMFQVDEINFISIDVADEADLQSFWRIPADANLTFEREDLLEADTPSLFIYQQKFTQ